MNCPVEVRTGSDSDIPRIRSVYDRLESLGISYAPRVLSAHRTPALMAEKARALEKEGFLVSIAAAGGSAHLPGMTASETLLPVIGIPVETQHLRGLDSLHSIIQMPDGVPVGSVGIGQAESAAWVAARMIAVGDGELRARIRAGMGLGDLAAPKSGGKPLVGILRPERIELPEAAHRDALDLLEQFGIAALECEAPAAVEDRLREGVSAVEEKGAGVIIALGDWREGLRRADFPGRLAGLTHLPVIGVLVLDHPLDPRAGPDGDPLEALLCSRDRGGAAGGYPLAGMGINKIRNAAIYAAQILGIYQPEVRKALSGYRNRLAAESKRKNELLGKLGVKSYLARDRA